MHTIDEKPTVQFIFSPQIRTQLICGQVQAPDLRTTVFESDCDANSRALCCICTHTQNQQANRCILLAIQHMLSLYLYCRNRRLQTSKAPQKAMHRVLDYSGALSQVCRLSVEQGLF